GPARGGFVRGVGELDADFFHLSPHEACDTDPQQRMVLELAWQAVEDAGLVLAGSAPQVGVFFGVMAADYADLVAIGARPSLPPPTPGGGGRGRGGQRGC